MNLRFHELPTHAIRGILIALAISLVVAFGIRIFLLRPYKISGHSMENTLLDGDHVLCNVWIHGWSLGSFHTPHFAQPKPWEILLLRRPLGPLSPTLRRCAAVSGQTVEIAGKRLFVDGKPFLFPRSAKASESVLVDEELALRDEMPRVRLPKRGDRLDLTLAEGLDVDFLAALIRQENRDKPVRMQCRLLIDRIDRSDMVLDGYTLAQGRFDQLPFDTMTWLDFQRIRLFLQQKFPGEEIVFKRRIDLDGKPLMQYAVKGDCYFVLSDRWDAYDDSRLWGYVSERAIIGRASFIYFSSAPHGGLFHSLRLGRLGRVIR